MLSFRQGRKATRHERLHNRPVRRHPSPQHEIPEVRTEAQATARDFARACYEAIAEVAGRTNEIFYVNDDILHALVPQVARAASVRGTYLYRQDAKGICPAVIYAFGGGSWTIGISRFDHKKRGAATLRKRADRKKIREEVLLYLDRRRKEAEKNADKYIAATT